jgi:GNAT superfamily N-acetyltransferase
MVTTRLSYSQSASEDVRTRALDRWQADNHRAALADLFVKSSPRAPGEEYERRQGFLDQLAADVQCVGFTMVVAETLSPGDVPLLVGCAYGYPLDRDGSWWPRLDGGVPPELEQLTAAGQMFAVAEFLVLPQYQRHEIAHELHDRLLDEQRQRSIAVMLVAPRHQAALEACSAWAWEEIGGTLRGDLRVFVRRLERAPGQPASTLPPTRHGMT